MKMMSVQTKGEPAGQEKNQNRLFLDQYIHNKNVQIINKETKNVSFKCPGPWIVLSFEIK